MFVGSLEINISKTYFPFTSISFGKILEEVHL